jgi:hypothetical protein
MRRLVLIGSAIAALAWGSVAAYASTATITTVTPWAYACGHTTFGTTTATKADTPDSNGCPANDVAGTANAALVAGTLTLSKLCASADAAKCTADDLASGATVKGLTTLTAASWDLGPESYCGAGAPRLDVVTSDGKTHFFGCAANKSGSHVSFNLTAAGDGNTALPVESRGIVGKTVTSIDIVQDETGTAVLMNLKFTGTAAVTATPTPTPTAAPTAAPTTPTLATTGGGIPIWPIGLLLAALGLAGLAIRRRTA